MKSKFFLCLLVIFSLLVFSLCSIYAASKTETAISDVSHSFSGDDLVLTWTPLTQTGDVSIYVSKDNGQVYWHLGSVPISDSTYTYSYRNNCPVGKELLFNFRIHEDYTGYKYNIVLSWDVECKFEFEDVVIYEDEPTNSDVTLSINETETEPESIAVEEESSSYLDKSSWYSEWNQQEMLSNWFTREKNNAYKFAYTYWLTSAETIESANMEWEITRAAMAKMMANFAKNILKKQPDTNKTCSFEDVSNELDAKYANWITESCQLWIMWVWITKFRPQNNVLRAEFWTVLSRLMFWIDDGDPYYEPHLRRLKEEWIISNNDPVKVEKRGNVLLMLMRSALSITKEKQVPVINNIIKEPEPQNNITNKEPENEKEEIKRDIPDSVEISDELLKKYNYTEYDKDMKFDEGYNYPFPTDLSDKEQVTKYYNAVKDNLRNIIWYINVENPENGRWVVSNETMLRYSKEYMFRIDGVLDNMDKWGKSCALAHFSLQDALFFWYKWLDGWCHNMSCDMNYNLESSFIKYCEYPTEENAKFNAYNYNS